MLASIASKAAIQAGVWLVTTPRGRKVLYAVIALIAIVPLALIGGAVAITLASTSSVLGAAADEQAAIDQACFTGASADQDPTRWATLTPDQQASARVIVGVVKAAYVAPGVADDTSRQQAAVVAIATSMQESHLTNLSGGDRDSLGLFQQRPSMSWGTPEQITDPAYATTAFLYGAGSNPGLVDVPGWRDLAVTIAAQTVQRSAYPQAYAKWGAFAQDVVTAAWADTPATSVAASIDRPDLSSTTATLRPVTVQVAAGSGEGCELIDPNSSGYSTTWDGIYHKPQSWGGYENGRIPLAALCVIPWQPAELARCDAVAALTKINEAWKADHGGQNLRITDSYRDYPSQVAVKAQKGGLAATPGKSNHGWGLALDLADFGSVGQYDAPNYLWMKQHAATYGWVHPPFMEAGGSGPLEPWHWEYMGTYTPPINPPGNGPTPI